MQVGRQFGKQGVKAGVLMAALATAGLVWAQDAQQKDQKPAAAADQQQVPDAPRPQTLPNLNTITPVAAALPETPQAPAAKPEVAADGQQAVGGSLPDGPVPTQASQDDGPPPDNVAAGDAQKYVLHQRVNFVEVPFTVKDSKGQLVPGLTWRDVRVYENGARQQMKFFTTDPFPLSVALVIDQSVTYDTMEKINASLAALQGAFTPYDEVAIFTYNNSVKKQTTFTAAQGKALPFYLENSKSAGREPLMPLGGPMSQTTSLNGHGVDLNTDADHGRPLSGGQYAPKEFHTLNDAILEAAKETNKAAKGRRRIVFVISDGKEAGSKAKEKDVIKYLQTNKVAVYATLVGDSAIAGLGFLDRIHLPLTMQNDVLPRYASATGGECDPEFRPKGIEASFAKITETVRTQYTVGYYSHESLLDSKYRKVEIRVMKPNLTVIAKEGYYPSSQDAPPVTPVAKPVATATTTP